jgi:hypothetical protein
METFIILLIFAGGPLAIVGFVLTGAISRAARKRKIDAALDKYLNA